MPLAPLLLGINNGTPFLNSICRIKLNNYSWAVIDKSLFHTIAVSGWPFKAAMCINVLPSFVRSNTEALNLSGRWINQQYLFVLWTTSFRVGLSPARNSTVEVWPFSAARCMGVLNIRTSNVISYWAMRHLSSLSVTEGLALARYRVLMIFSSPLLQAMCKHVWPSSYMFSVV